MASSYSRLLLDSKPLFKGLVSDSGIMFIQLLLFYTLPVLYVSRKKRHLDHSASIDTSTQTCSSSSSRGL